jgi:hypothetical protein
MEATSIVTAFTVNDWLKNNDEDRKRMLYSGFSMKEFIQILKLPNSMASAIIDDLTMSLN